VTSPCYYLRGWHGSPRLGRHVEWRWCACCVHAHLAVNIRLVIRVQEMHKTRGRFSRAGVCGRLINFSASGGRLAAPASAIEGSVALILSPCINRLIRTSSALSFADEADT